MSAQATRLAAWLQGAGISWDGTLIQMRPTGGGLGVFAVADIQESAALCEIPRAAVLSVRCSLHSLAVLLVTQPRRLAPSYARSNCSRMCRSCCDINRAAGVRQYFEIKGCGCLFRNTGIADLLALHGIREGLGLSIAILYELSIGQRSPWRGSPPFTSILIAREGSTHQAACLPRDRASHIDSTTHACRMGLQPKGWQSCGADS